MPERFDPALLGELLGLLAHDLRNPLSALHTNLGYLGSVVGSVDADAREAVADGVVSCDGLAHIIDNIDLVGRAMRPSEAVETATFGVAALVADAITGVRVAARSHGVDLTVASVSDQGPTVRGGREFLLRALGNLLRNAIQHTPAGKAIGVSVGSRDGSIVALVEDPGTPLPVDARELAFTAAGQAGSKSGPSDRYSRGLGLYAAALAAAAGGGSVRAVDPPRGTGSAFELVMSRG